MIRFDCHAHVYEHVTAVAGARYVPSRPAPLDRWLSLQRDHGLRGGVIVQVSFLGIDNSQLLGALSRLDRGRFAGVACVSPDVDGMELQRLAAAGVAGVRWNLVSGAPLPEMSSVTIQGLLDRLRTLGMHLEVQLESARLADYLPALSRAPVPVVIDHMGLPISTDARSEPWLNALDSSSSRRDPFFVKVSAPYRGVPDIRGHLDRLADLLPPGRLFWGSDWPHTRHEHVALYAGALADLTDRIDDTGPARDLYGLG